MGLTKQYLRYKPCGKFNIIGSTWAKIAVLGAVGKSKASRICAVGACEDVHLWNLRTSEKVASLPGDRHCVTALARSFDSRLLAVGYHNGAVRVFDVSSGECQVTFSGHKTQVSALNFDETGAHLVSGGLDTDVIVWDVVAETGLYRLHGHKGQITQSRFVQQKNILVTSSKDATVKFWNLDTQHCFQTLVGHSREVWDFVLVKENTLLITSSADHELRVWKLKYDDQTSEDQQAVEAMEVDSHDNSKHNAQIASDGDAETQRPVQCIWVGSVMRQPTKDHVSSLVVSSDGNFIVCHGNNSNIVELFRILEEADIQKRLQKRMKKLKKKSVKEGGDTAVSVTVERSIEDEIRLLAAIRLTHKVHSLQCVVEKSQAKIVALLKNNSIQTCSLDITVRHPEPVVGNELVMPGHRTEPRALCFSSDNTAILSASGDSARIWNRATLQCIRSMNCEYAVCCMFAPGDRYIIIGTKTGKLQIFDLSSSLHLETVEAHSNSVTSMCLAPDKRSIVTGSLDKEVKFWDFELVSDETSSSASRRLTLVHTRTLQMAEGVLCAKYSSDHKLLAVSLLDNTVKIFFSDTCKFFLNLYGHSLPVTCLDMSTDVTIIVTGSNDKSVRIWGLDFGNCLKFIRAHDAPIQSIQFIAKTHMFFTCSNDSTIKQWDADTFEEITTLHGHHDFVNCMAVSPNGGFVVSGSHDRSIRLWQKTDEILVLSEEREMEREKANDEAAVSNAEVIVAGETNAEIGVAGKQTVETVQAAERLMEALDIHKEETEKLLEYMERTKSADTKVAKPPINPMFQAFGVQTPNRYVWEILKRIKSSELEETLLVLPFTYVIRLLELMQWFIENCADIELSQRILGFLLRIHHGQITSNQILLPVIDELQRLTTAQAQHLQDVSGFVLAGLRYNKQRLEERESATFFVDATQRLGEKRRRKKKAALLTIHT